MPVFGQKKWVFAHFQNKSGRAVTVAITGFEGSLPTFPLFFFIYTRKEKSIKYI
nr:MAG TPA: hypothetical protein [Caudoviricetes sp.]